MADVEPPTNKTVQDLTSNATSDISISSMDSMFHFCLGRHVYQIFRRLNMPGPWLHGDWKATTTSDYNR